MSTRQSFICGTLQLVDHLISGQFSNNQRGATHGTTCARSLKNIVLDL